MRIDVDKVMNDARGRWQGIISALGIAIDFSGKHGPCPVCNAGKDRFRFTDKGGDGRWICNQCGAGNGIQMIQKKLGLSFPETLEKVSEIMGNVPKEKKKAEKDYRKMLNDTWRLGQNLVRGDPVMEYLAGRGLKLIPDQVKYLPACWESDTKKRMRAMIALVSGPDGKPVTIHRTYLQDGKKAPIESPKKLMPHNGTLKGAAVRLFAPEQGVLGIAEGVETAVGATQLFKVPTWAAISANIMEQWEPPKGIETVFIFGDHDLNYTGQKSAYILANKLSLKNIQVHVKIPDEIGDWNDD